MAFKMFSTGLVLAFAGMCLCQQQSTGSYQASLSANQQPQTKLEDIERDNLIASYGQKIQQQPGKPSTTVPQQQLQQQTYQAAVPQPQYFVQPYQAQQQQYYVQQPFQAQQQQYLVQPYQTGAFDYPGIQYMFISPNGYNPTNQVYQQYYVPSTAAAAQPSAVPQYVTKQSSPAVTAPVQNQQEYKQLQFATSAQVPQEYKQQTQFIAPARAQQEYKQQFSTQNQAPQEYKPQQFTAPAQALQQYKQQYVLPAPTFHYVQSPSATGPVDYSYVTRHPSPSAATTTQFKAPATAPVAPAAAQFKAQATSAVQPQFQYTAVPQQYQQQPQYYYTNGQIAATAEQSQVQQSAKSQFSSGVKSTTPFPVKESFAYKFESSPVPQQQQQQQSGAIYSTIKYSA